MHPHRRVIAYQQRPAQGFHPRVECGLERDFRADSGWVSDGDGDAGHAHGSSFAGGACAYNGKQ